MKEKTITIKKKFAALTLAISVFAASVSAFAFSDVSDNHWANKDIAALTNAGYVSGYSDDSFKPDSKITRAEFVTIVNKMTGVTATTQETFSDVSADAWYASAISKAVVAGFISGYGDGTIKPENEITRAEAAVIICRAWKYNQGGNVSFADSENIPAWAKIEIGTLVSKGIISGYEDNTFRPENSITRAEVAKMLNSLLNNGAIVATVAPTGLPSIGGIIISNGGGSGSGGSSASTPKPTATPTATPTVEPTATPTVAPTLMPLPTSEPVVEAVTNIGDVFKEFNASGSEISIDTLIDNYNVIANAIEEDENFDSIPAAKVEYKEIYENVISAALVDDSINIDKDTENYNDIVVTNFSTAIEVVNTTVEQILVLLNDDSADITDKASLVDIKTSVNNIINSRIPDANAKSTLETLAYDLGNTLYSDCAEELKELQEKGDVKAEELVKLYTDYLASQSIVEE